MSQKHKLHMPLPHACRFLILAVAAAFLSTAAWAQQTRRTAGESDDGRSAAAESELAIRNLSRVAASGAQIRAVLASNPGLLVELKRWIAQDAASHGQIVRDVDLMDDSIFDRLETDIRFRSVATSLLQKYGYLVPDINPESQAGKEQALLIQERTKWMAQAQEEELAQARTRQQAHQATQNAAYCGPRLPETCPPSQTGAPQGFPDQTTPENAPVPNAPWPPSGPNGSSSREIRMTQIAQPDQDATDVFFPTSANMLAGSGTYPRNMSISMNNTQRALSGDDTGSDTNPMTAMLSGLGGSPDSLNTLGSRSFDSSNMGAGALLQSGALSSGLSGPTQSSNAPYSYRTETERLRRFTAPGAIQPVELVRKANPYVDVPSLYDMYVQATPRPTMPKRFGAQIFEDGTRDVDVIPMDLPAGPDYVLGPGDGLSINLWGSVSQRLTRTVDREGRIALPEVGPILVSGKSIAEVQESAQQALRSQFRDVSVDVSLSRLRTVRVYEVGDVQTPGAYDVSTLSTPLSALFEAGGPTDKGSMRILKHFRGNQLVQVVDAYDLLLHGVKGNMERLESGDTILVPPIGPQVTIEGMVRRPAVYELRDEKTLADALELAGGLLPVAALRHIEVERTVAHEKRTMLSLDIPEAGGSAEADKKLQSFEIQDGDRIRIFPIAPYDQDTVYVEGHVVRPGKYSYRKNMHVTDLIGSHQDLLPEPSMQYAEIIRLHPPDFRPTVDSFNLEEALSHPDKSPVLQPLDTVRVFSRFDFEDPPMVSVLGEVRTPGDYRTSGDIHLIDAIHLAGGLGPDAATGDAQIFRSLPNGKSEIFSVNLSRALEGDSVENIVLAPRDRLLIHRTANAVDPQTVSIEGEVGNPGRYPLTDNLRVSDLIRTAGGLMPSADSVTGDLVRFEWSDQNKLIGQHETIDLPAALKGTASSNALLHNGDVLTIRQLPGWNDLGASIALKGEVKHPGTYGIRPGEKLSSVIERAGGFQPDAYPFGAILQRTEVREVESQARNEMILRIKDSQASLQLLPESTPQEKQAKLVALQQWQTALNEVSANPPVGRVVIRVSSDINHWKNTPADIEVRSRDTLIVPKRPNVVMVTGQVFNPTAVLYHPGKSAKWYLSQSGGPTQLANKKAIFVIRADGSVIGSKSGPWTGLWSGDSLNAALQPGDTVVVPDRAVGGGVQWQTVLLASQVASSAASIASAVFIALHP
jgi:protein involved in polysaccharide export with SLBB domain